MHFRPGCFPVLPQAQFNFHILKITHDRNVHEISLESRTYRPDRLFGLKLDQGQYQERIEGIAVGSAGRQLPFEHGDAVVTMAGMIKGDCFQARRRFELMKLINGIIAEVFLNGRDRIGTNQGKNLRKFPAEPMIVRQAIVKTHQGFRRFNGL